MVKPTRVTVHVLDPSDLRALLATPPPGFVAARNALVKRLRAAKERASATSVAGIRRPAWSEWALNVTSQSHPDEIAAFADAAAAVRDAQTAAIEGRRADVRQALAGLRDCTASIARHANGALRDEGRPEETPQLRTLLAGIAADPDTVEQLRDGVLGAADTGTSSAFGEQFADLQVAPQPRRAAARQGRSPTRSRPARSNRSESESEQEADPDPPAVSAAVRRELMRALAAAERVLQRSQRDLTKAEEAANDAAAVVTRAEAQLAAARQSCDDALAIVERDQAARDDAAKALDATS